MRFSNMVFISDFDKRNFSKGIGSKHCLKSVLEGTGEVEWLKERVQKINFRMFTYKEEYINEDIAEEEKGGVISFLIQ